MIRITGGALKGIRLSVPKAGKVRPTAERVRESLFNIIRAYLLDAEVLDLFAGTGALGIEALSRGAKEVVFVENNRAVLRVLKDNLEKCNLTQKSLILPLSVTKALSLLKASNKSFDLIFADPPYSMASIEELIPPMLSLLKEGGIAVIEHDENRLVNLVESGFTIEDKRKIGQTVITFLKSGGRL